MGCGASSSAEKPEEEEEQGFDVEIGPGGLQLAAWWLAGEVLPGTQVDDGLEAPTFGPFAPRTNGSPEHVGKVLFSASPVDSEGKTDPSALKEKYTLGDTIYARAFFASSLPSYSVGWSRLELSKDRPHYNTKKVREREQMMIEQGRELDYSKRKKYFLYPECIKEIGVFIRLNNNPVTTDVAISSDSWAIEPIEGAFFTFAPERGSVYGTQAEGPDASMPLFFRPAEDDPRYRDARWARLQLELLKELKKQGDGTHTLAIEIAYRYGNWKFVAWNAAEQQSNSRTPAYRYSDEERDSEEEISTSIAKGQFQIKVTKADAASLPSEIEKLEQVFDQAYKKQTQS